MKLRRLLAVSVVLLFFAPPNPLHPQERPARKVAPIHRPPGYDELKKQADDERRAAERAARAPLAPIEQPTTSAVGTPSGFDGMDFGDSPHSVPPDTHAAAGPNHIVEVVNSAIAIYDRPTGTAALGYPKNLSSFFASIKTSDCLFDPIVGYDELVGRFVVGVLDVPSVCVQPPNTAPQTANLLYAVSDSDDPTGGFSEMHRINVAQKGSRCSGTVGGDFTRFGWNADAHVFTFNMFSLLANCFDHVSVIVIDKSTVADADNSTFSFHHFDRKVVSNTNFDFTLTPTVMHGSNCGDPMWFAESLSSNAITLVKMTNVLSASPTFTKMNVLVTDYDSPPSATQKNNPQQTIDTGDSRILNVEWRNDRLVATHTIGLPVDSPTLARARWYEFNTSATPTKTQEGTIAPVSTHTYYPSVAINANGDIGMTFMQSSSSEFMSMYVTGQSFGDAPNTMQSAVLAKAGAADYIAFDCDPNDTQNFVSLTCRAGDFSGITADPSAPDTFCAANEYATSASSDNWGTWIACFSMPQNLASAALTRPVSLSITPRTPLVCEPPQIHDLAVTAIKAPKSVSGGSLGNVFGAVSVTIQNRSDHAETVTLQNLNDGLVTLDVEVGSGGTAENCNPASVMLDPVKTPALFSKGPKILKIGGTLTVTFRVTYNCSNPLAKALDSDIADYTHTATVDHEALAGSHADDDPDDDMCPRAPLPLGLDPNPPPKGTKDKGCGAKTSTGIGGPVVTNILP